MRNAVAPLRGFYYQFLKTIIEILDANDSVKICVEGIEDIDIFGHDEVTFVQCKYHETVDKFTLGIIYKPILLMLQHYSLNPTLCDNYKLYLHTNDKTYIDKYDIHTEDIDKILSSKNKQFNSIISSIPPSIDKTKFLNKLTIEFGPSLEELENKVKSMMIESELENSFIDELFYPNALSYIGELSCQKNEIDRMITKGDLIKFLQSQSDAIFSKWTLLIHDRERFIKRKKKQISSSLSQNARLRCLIINSDVDNFEEEIVNMIISFSTKYASKPKLHIFEPIFLIDCSEQSYKKILKSLHSRNQYYNECSIAGDFNIKQATKKPLIEQHGKEVKKEFYYRIARLDAESIHIIDKLNPHDLYIINHNELSVNCPSGTCTERLYLSNMFELEFIMGVRDTYE